MTVTAAQDTEPTPDKLALSVKEVLARIPIKRSRLYEEMRDGRLRRKKVGSRTLILAGDLDDWLANLENQTSASS